jgi:hypothetical protein
MTLYISRESETEIATEAYCDTCGSELSVHRAEETRQSEQKRTITYYVEPCDKCLEAAREEGNKAGYDDGLSDGRAEAS